MFPALPGNPGLWRSNCRITRSPYLSTTSPGNSSASPKTRRQALGLFAQKRPAPGGSRPAAVRPAARSHASALTASRDTIRREICDTGAVEGRAQQKALGCPPRAAVPAAVPFSRLIDSMSRMRRPRDGQLLSRSAPRRLMRAPAVALVGPRLQLGRDFRGSRGVLNREPGGGVGGMSIQKAPRACRPWAPSGSRRIADCAAWS